MDFYGNLKDLYCGWQGLPQKQPWTFYTGSCIIHCFCDLNHRHMYWANGGEDPKIERADLDGSNRRTVVTNVTRPTGLTIDFSLGLIFWVDGKNKVIECAHLNGTNRRTVATELPKPFALTQYKDYIYWADWKLSSIYRANKTNGMDRTQIKGNIDFIMDILVFHSSRQEGLYIQQFSGVLY